MKKTIVYSLLFILFLGIFLVVNAPAKWVYQQFVEPKIANMPIEVSLPQGTIWNGSTAIKSDKTIPYPFSIQNIQWKLDWQLIKQRVIGFRIDFESVQGMNKSLGSLQAIVGYSLEGAVVRLLDTQSPLDLNLTITVDKTPKTVKGHLKFRKPDPELQNLFVALLKIQPDGRIDLKF